MAAIAVLPVAVWAQTAATTSLRGVVVDAQTHRPIARVLVEETNGSGVLTDNSGQFRLDGLALGLMTVRYRRPGYFDPYSQQESASATVVLSDETAPVTVALEKAAAIHGLVQAPDGDSADGMRVDLYSAMVTEGHRHWQLLRTARVEGDGSFAFDGLEPGSYLVHSEASMDLVPQGAPTAARSGYAPLFAPGSGELSGATVYAVGPGETAEARVQLRRVAFQPVTVKVAGGDLPGGFFEVTGNGFTHWRVAYSEQDGVLSTELPNGRYRLHGSARGEGDSRTQRVTLEGDLPFQVGGTSVSGLTLQMSATPPMQLTTTVSGDAPAKAAGSVGDDGPRLYTLEFLPADNPEQAMISDGVDQSLRGDTQPLQQAVAPGRYWVVPVLGGAYVAALSGDGVDLLREPLTVTAGAAPRLRTVLGQDGGTVQIMLGGDLAGHACRVQLIPLDGQAEPPVLTNGGGLSPINVRNVAPGNYLAVALSGRKEIAYQEPGVLQGLDGEHVRVTTGGTAQVTITRQARLPGSAGAN
jgi:hypothetical protein